MGLIMKFLPILSLFSLLVLPLSFPLTAHAATFTVQNNCDYTVWAASILPSGGQPLNKGQNWTLSVAPGINGSRIWGRTECNFNSGSTQQPCKTGDCGNNMACPGPGKGPATLAEFTLSGQQPGVAVDYYDISIADGYNIPMSLAPTSVPSGSSDCALLRCDSPTCLGQPDIHTCSSGHDFTVVFCPNN